MEDCYVCHGEWVDGRGGYGSTSNNLESRLLEGPAGLHELCNAMNTNLYEDNYGPIRVPTPVAPPPWLARIFSRRDTAASTAAWVRSSASGSSGCSSAEACAAAAAARRLLFTWLMYERYVFQPEEVLVQSETPITHRGRQSGRRAVGAAAAQTQS
jgi:hypothetical protein